jgi:RNA polymerase sigma-70 factor (ECF subfamily)
MDAPQDQNPDRDASDDERSRWMEHYRPILLEIAKKQLDPSLGSKLDASDAIQETFIAATSKINQAPETKREFLGFLRLLLANTILDFKRRFILSKKRDISRESSRDELSSDELKLIISPNDEPLDNLITDELLDRSRNAIEALPPEIRTILRWKYEDELTFREIGARLSRSEDDVRMFIKRIILRIRRDVEETE